MSYQTKTIPEFLKSNSTKITDGLILAGLAIFAFILCFKSGERGFFPFDQSIVFDGGYRVFLGQIPFKDFVIPFGPVVFWLQGLFFKILGVNYFAYLFHAALINLLATLISALTIRLIYPSSKTLSYFVGFITAIWFYPPFGTPWVEQTAFFFSILAIFLISTVIASRDNPSTKSIIIMIFAGLFSFIAFISKQNVGIFIFPVFILLIIFSSLPSFKKIIYQLGVFFIGLGTSLLLFILWIKTYSDSGTFLKYFLSIPSAVGINRLRNKIFNPARLFTIVGNWPIIFSIPIVLIFILALLVFFSNIVSYLKTRKYQKKNLLSAVFAISLISFQFLFILTTGNQIQNGFPFLGIILGLGTYLASSWITAFASRPLITRKIHTSVKIFAGSIAIGFFSIISYYGISVSLNRIVQGGFNISNSPTYLDIEDLENLRLMTTGNGNKITEQDIYAITGYLQSLEGNFFIFPDFTLLYGILDVRSPQPILWFDPGLTYPRAYDVSIDHWIVDDLIKNNVRFIIIEKKSFFGTKRRLYQFPLLTAFIGDHFEVSDNIGNFTIFTKSDLLP